VLLLAGGGVAAYLLTKPAQKVVPGIVNDQLNVARTVLQNAGFKVAPPIQVTDQHPAGIVIGQDPVGGKKVDKGSTVTLTVSSGPGTVQVPTVSGDPLPNAERLIRQAKLKVGPIHYQKSSQYAQGEVINTAPAAAQLVAPGTPVAIFVSSGAPLKKVPDVTGQSQDSAKSALQNAGFQVTVTTQPSSTVAAGKVLSQNPAGGSQAASGSTVTIVVAKAQKNTNVNVPNVKSDPPALATSTLQAAGFTVSETTKNVTSSSKNGIVVEQTPAGGSSAKKGSKVTIVIGHFKAPTTTTTTSTTTTPHP
jgi:serine/threonine-protein kinase